MDLDEFSGKFSSLPPVKKSNSSIRRSTAFERRIKSVFSSPLVQAMAIKCLRQTSYRGAEIFEQFQDDHFLSAARAAKKALRDRKTQEKRDLCIA